MILKKRLTELAEVSRFLRAAYPAACREKYDDDRGEDSTGQGKGYQLSHKKY